MNTGPSTWSSTLAALMTALMLAGPAGAGPAASALKPSVQFHDPDGDVLAIDVDIERSGADATLYPLVWGRGTNLSGRVEFAVDKMSIYLDKPLGKSTEQVTIVHDGKDGQGVDSSPAGAAAFYVEPIEVSDSKRRLIVKAWPVGTHTRLGVWGHDKGNGKWQHYVTFDSPTDYATLANGTFSAAANDRKEMKFKDTMGVFNGWKRYAGSSWYPMQSATAFKIGTDATKDQFIVYDAGALKPSELTVRQTETVPSMKPPEVTSVRATTDLKTTWVDWEVADTGAPQFRYAAELLNDSNQVVQREEGIGPHVRRVAFAYSDAKPFRARLTVTNLLDVSAKPSYAESVLVTSPQVTRMMPSSTERRYLEVRSVDSKPGDPLVIGDQQARDRSLQTWELRRLFEPGEYELRSVATGRCATWGMAPSGATLVERPCVGQGFFLLDFEGDYRTDLHSDTYLIPWKLIKSESRLLQADANGNPTIKSVNAFFGAVFNTRKCVAYVLGLPRFDKCTPSYTAMLGEVDKATPTQWISPYPYTDGIYPPLPD